MSIQSVSFKQANSKELKSKNYLPLAGAAAVVTTGAGAAGGYYFTKLNEDNFVKASIAEQLDTASKDIIQGRSKLIEILGADVVEADAINTQNLLLRRNLDAADAEFVKVAYWNNGVPVKLDNADQAAFNKAVKEQKKAYEGLLNAVGEPSKMLSEKEFIEKGNKIRSDAISKLPENMKSLVSSITKSVSDAESKFIEVMEHCEFTPSKEKPVSDLAQKFKNMFASLNSSSRDEVLEKKVVELTAKLKKYNAVKYAAVGAILGAVALVSAVFANKSHKA